MGKKRYQTVLIAFLLLCHDGGCRFTFAPDNTIPVNDGSAEQDVGISSVNGLTKRLQDSVIVDRAKIPPGKVNDDPAKIPQVSVNGDPAKIQDSVNEDPAKIQDSVNEDPAKIQNSVNEDPAKIQDSVNEDPAKIQNSVNEDPAKIPHDLVNEDPAKIPQDLVKDDPAKIPQDSANDDRAKIPQELVNDDPISAYDSSVKSPCSVENIPSSGDVFVDCQNRDISRIDPRWFPTNTTILKMDHNNIKSLENNTFSHLEFLRNLSICCSNVAEIQVDALKGLRSLEYLNLEKNGLDLACRYRAFPKMMFNHVPKLRYLHIWRNSHYDNQLTYNVSYAKFIDIFDSVRDLESLTIDTISQVVYLGQEFDKLHHLKSLNLHAPDSFFVPNSGYFLTNDTFLGLQTLNLSQLNIEGIIPHTNNSVDTGLFQHVSHLESLTVSTCHFGNHVAAKLMWPFVNKTMSFLRLDDVQIYYHKAMPDNVIPDGIITRETTEYLGKICIAEFGWVHSRLLAIEHQALTTLTWRRCLKKIDLSYNVLQVSSWHVGLIGFDWLSSLETFTAENNLNGGEKYHINATVHKTFRQRKNSGEGGKLLEINHMGTQNSSEVDNVLKPNQQINTSDNIAVDVKDSVPTANHSGHHRQDGQKIPHKVPANPAASQKYYRQEVDADSQERTIQIWLPRNLRSISVRNILPDIIFADNRFNYIIRRAENLQEMYVTYMQRFISSPMRISGLKHLKLLDLSYSLVRVRENFFDDFPGIEILVLRGLLPNNYFDKVISCKDLIRNMPNLRYLDISNNGLNSLPHGTFSSNPELTHIILSRNRFSTMPFNLHLIPKLEVLDLSYNAILYLDDDVRIAIDAHVAKVDAFYLKLEGNGLVCVCSQIRFLAWQQTTLAYFDNDGNYSCTSEDGKQEFTKNIGDILDFWRQCEGRLMFLVSLVLASLLAVAMLTAYLTTRFQNAMVAFFLRIFAPQFRPMTISDYKTAVFVGYADDDYRFVIYVLQRYLEDSLKVSTFIHQRDLLAGGKDELFFEAIQNSWRILLVITDNFLNNYDMAEKIMKYASYSVSPVNRERVMVLVEETQLHNIPDFVHAVLDDSKIVTLPDMDAPLDYHHQQAIKNFVLSR